MKAVSPIIENFLKSTPLPNIKGMSVQELRQKFQERQKIFNQNLPSYSLAIKNLSANTGQGSVPMRIYRSQNDDILPVLIFFHGGGFVFGDLDSLECYCREIAHFANCLVISVDYPLAPEHPFPAAPESAYAAVNW